MSMGWSTTGGRHRHVDLTDALVQRFYLLVSGLARCALCGVVADEAEGEGQHSDNDFDDAHAPATPSYNTHHSDLFTVNGSLSTMITRFLFQACTPRLATAVGKRQASVQKEWEHWHGVGLDTGDCSALKRQYWCRALDAEGTGHRMMDLWAPSCRGRQPEDRIPFALVRDSGKRVIAYGTHPTLFGTLELRATVAQNKYLGIVDGYPVFKSLKRTVIQDLMRKSATGIEAIDDSEHIKTHMQIVLFPKLGLEVVGLSNGAFDAQHFIYICRKRRAATTVRPLLVDSAVIDEGVLSSSVLRPLSPLLKAGEEKLMAAGFVDASITPYTSSSALHTVIATTAANATEKKKKQSKEKECIASEFLLQMPMDSTTMESSEYLSSAYSKSHSATVAAESSCELFETVLLGTGFNDYCQMGQSLSAATVEVLPSDIQVTLENALSKAGIDIDMVRDEHSATGTHQSSQSESSSSSSASLEHGLDSDSSISHLEELTTAKKKKKKTMSGQKDNDDYLPSAVRLTQSMLRLNMDVFGGREVVSVSCGVWHSVFLCADGCLFACGYNYQGQCGQSPVAMPIVKEPTLIPYFGGGASKKEEEEAVDDAKRSSRQKAATKKQRPLKRRHIVKVVCGNFHTLALDEKGKVFGFGANHRCQLGLGHCRSTGGRPHRIRTISVGEANAQEDDAEADADECETESMSLKDDISEAKTPLPEMDPLSSVHLDVIHEVYKPRPHVASAVVDNDDADATDESDDKIVDEKIIDGKNDATFSSVAEDCSSSTAAKSAAEDIASEWSSLKRTCAIASGLSEMAEERREDESEEDEVVTDALEQKTKSDLAKELSSEKMRKTAALAPLRLVDVVAQADFSVCVDERFNVWVFGDFLQRHNIWPGTEPPLRPQLLYSGRSQKGPIQKVAVGQSHIVLLTAFGNLYTIGDNNHSQCALRMSMISGGYQYARVEDVMDDLALGCEEWDDYSSAVTDVMCASASTFLRIHSKEVKKKRRKAPKTSKGFKGKASALAALLG